MPPILKWADSTAENGQRLVPRSPCHDHGFEVVLSLASYVNKLIHLTNMY